VGTWPGLSPRVELRLAGAFGVSRDGTELSEGELGSRKSRTLLKLLAVERPALVSLDRIVEVLWADPPAAAGQNVATLVSTLRGVLGPGVILGSRQAYRLAGPAAETLLRAASVLGAAIEPLTLGELLQLTPPPRSSAASKPRQPGCRWSTAGTTSSPTTWTGRGAG